MGCLRVAANITNQCSNRPIGGIENVAYILNRDEFTATVSDNLVTNLVMDSGKVAFKIETIKKSKSAGHDLVTADNFDVLFNHYFALQPWNKSADNIRQMDEMDDIVAIIELKGNKTEGKFIMLGLETGMHLTSATMRTDNERAIPSYEFRSLGETYSKHVLWKNSYSETLSIVQGLINTEELFIDEDLWIDTELWHE